MALKLLLADDSITIQKVVELILADEDYEIRSVNNGEEALALFASFQPDIVLADTEMPLMNGYDLCERIKQDPATKMIPVIPLTGAFEPLDEARADQVKADDCLIKPFEAQELIQKIDAALAGKAVPAQTEIPTEEKAVHPEELLRDEELWQAKETLPAEMASGLEVEEIAGAGTEEMAGFLEQEAAVAQSPQESINEEVRPAEHVATIPVIEHLSKEEIKEIFEKTVKERVSSLLSSADLKETLIASMTPFIKDSVDKILWDLTPELIERMLKEILKGSIESLTTEVQKVIWETVPELAETMISQEIERIRSEF
jgi:CheY-like chemotaxis protein